MNRPVLQRVGKLARINGVADLIAFSFELRHDDPKAMLSVAYKAVEAANREQVPDLCAGAWGCLGNALRVTGSLQEAGDALTEAERWLGLQGSALPVRRAEISRYRASWHVARNELELSRRCLAAASSIYEALNDMHGVAVCKVKEAATWNYGGEPDRAFRCVLSALPSVGEDKNLLRAAWETGVFSLLEADRITEAVALMALGHEVLSSGGAAYRRKVRWAEGLLAAKLGSLEPLEVIRDEYSAEGNLSLAAQVALDVARHAVMMGDHCRFEANAALAKPLLVASGLQELSTAGQLLAARRYLAATART